MSGAGEANGVLLLDKPRGITSHDAVARVRRALATKKVGHAGTLDPMATGLLLIGVGPSTRLLTYLVGLDKEYFATIRLGQATTTDDAEGAPIPPERESGSVASAGAATESLSPLVGERLAAISTDALAAGVAALTGEISQRPSAVSAIKVDGVRAYDRVRAGEQVELAPRRVAIRAFEVLGVRRGEFLDLDVRVECSSGTYIRALARDLGEGLGVGGHLTALRRTRVGPFRVEEAVPVPERGDASATASRAPVPLDRRLLHPAAVAGCLFPVVRLDEAEARDLGDGKRLDLSADRLAAAVPRIGAPSGAAGRHSAAGSTTADTAIVAAVAPDGRLVGLVSITGGRTRVLTNFPVPTAAPKPHGSHLEAAPHSAEAGVAP